LRRRGLWGSSPDLHFNSLNTDLKPVMHEIGSIREYTWGRENVTPIQVDDRTPAWFDPYPGGQLTDFLSWGDVGAWALPLYNTNPPLAAELSRQILMWRMASARQEDQILAALRFVQDEVRYLAIEIGPNSNKPNSPSVVFKRRYGDCKDKSLLLTTILNEPGIDARPALVNTQGPKRLNQFQPSPFAFDNCIV